MFKDIKVLKNAAFKDKRGMLWTTWKKGVFKKIKFNHDKFSFSKKMSFVVCIVILNLGKW